MKHTILAIAALLVAVASSCDKEPQSAPPVNPLPADGVIRVSTTVAGTTTRAGRTDNTLTSFRLSIKNSANDSYSYSNVLMSYRNSEWKAFDDENNPMTLLWQNATTPVTVVAKTGYYGDVTGTVSINVQQDQSTDTGSQNSDYLYASSVVTPSGEQNTDNAIYYDATEGVKGLRIKFGHANSKLRVNIKYGTEMTLGGATPALTAGVLKGTNNNGILDVATGVVTPNTSTPLVKDITMYREKTPTTGFAATYEAIVIPQEATFGITLTVDGKPYVYSATAAAQKFEAGTCHVLTLTVGRDVVEAGDFTVAPWDDETTGGDLVTE